MVLTQHVMLVVLVYNCILVSIPLWFSRNRGYPALSSCSELVSIPLWFSRNVTTKHSEFAATMFPYHYGSHATKNETGRI